MKEELEGRILRFDRTVKEHSNWKDSDKKEPFFRSFTDFYAGQFTDCKKEWMEENEISEYIFVGLDFIGIGGTYSNVISVIPYSSEDEFTDMVFDLLKEYNSLAVFIPRESSQTYLNGMVERASEKLNAEYDGNIMEYTYEPGVEIMSAEEGNMVPLGYWKRKQKAVKFIEEFVKESGIPIMEIENIDGSILYSFTANTSYGPMYGLELTKSGFLEPRFSRCESFDIHTESMDIVGVPSNKGTVWIRKQDNVPYKN